MRTQTELRMGTHTGLRIDTDWVEDSSIGTYTGLRIALWEHTLG